MGKDGNFLESLAIATPCKADWASMSGDERVRFCGLCRLNVYNLSGMTRAEAEALVKKAEGRVCVRLFKRADGTVLTQDCPLGVRIARRVKRTVAIAASALASILGLGAFAYARASVEQGRAVEQPDEPRPLMGEPTVPPLMGKVSPPREEHVMGGLEPPEHR